MGDGLFKMVIGWLVTRTGSEMGGWPPKQKIATPATPVRFTTTINDVQTAGASM